MNEGEKTNKKAWGYIGKVAQKLPDLLKKNDNKGAMARMQLIRRMQLTNSRVYNVGNQDLKTQLDQKVTGYESMLKKGILTGTQTILDTLEKIPETDQKPTDKDSKEKLSLAKWGIVADSA